VSTKRIPVRKWPRRSGGERRVHARVRVRFPVLVDPGDAGEPFHGQAQDIGLGGLAVLADRPLDLYQRVEVAFVVPVTGPEGEVALHPLSGMATLVRLEPDDPPEGAEPILLGFEFSRSEPERDRILGVFLLQTLLFDPDAELV
jgi:hypothetical protein